MKIAIVGLGKTGTTALFFALKQALPPGTSCLFEPRSYDAAGGDSCVLAKVVIGFNRPGDLTGFLRFDRKVLLLRDVRLIRGDCSSIESYVGVPLMPGPVSVTGEFARVARSKGDWRLADRPEIRSEHATGYVRRLVNERRQLSPTI